MSAVYFNSTIVAAAATGVITVGGTPDDGDWVNLNGAQYTFSVGGLLGPNPVDTASGDPTTIANNLQVVINSISLGRFLINGGGPGVLDLTDTFAGSSGNAAITVRGSAVTASGMSGGRDASGTAGKIDDANNLWSDSAEMVRLGRTLSSADDLSLDDAPTNGTASVNSATDLGSNPLNGATLTVATSTAISVSGGTLTCPAHTGAQSGGTVVTGSYTAAQSGGAAVMNGALGNGNFNYSPSAHTSGTVDLSTYSANCTTGFTIVDGPISITVEFPGVDKVISPTLFGISDLLQGIASAGGGGANPVDGILAR